VNGGNGPIALGFELRGAIYATLVDRFAVETEDTGAGNVCLAGGVLAQVDRFYVGGMCFAGRGRKWERLHESLQLGLGGSRDN
jgi:hypothetical protein